MPSLTDNSAAATLEGAWVPVDARVGGTPLAVADLRVRYLLLEGGAYRIIDGSNQVVDGGEYHVDAASAPASMDIVGRSGPHAGRTLRAIYELSDDLLTVCYDLEDRGRPTRLEARDDEVLLCITYTRTALGLGPATGA
jgi:uncharacterized protein (TIGR03067 family)